MPTKTLISILILAAASIASTQTCQPPTQTAVIAHPSGTILPDIGTSDMPITTPSAKAAQLTRQGFALIHCYWPDEAIRSFRDAVKEDPTCAVAWCGLNIAMTQPWFRDSKYNAEAEYAIKKAIANIDSASEPEQDLIRAFRLRSIGKDDRDSEFEKAMAILIEKHPKLDEPRVLWAGIRAQLCANVNYLKNGDPRGDLDFVVKLVEPVLKRSPNNTGAMHYWIHANEPRNPKRAEKAADNLLKVGKGSPHLVHMPGHIYNRLGRYEDGQRAFGRAKTMDEDLAAKFKVSPSDADWQYHHNVSFQTMNLLELGRINESIELSKIAGNTRNDIAVRVGDWKNAVDSSRSDAEGIATRNAYLARQDLENKDFAAARVKIEAAKKAIEGAEPDGWGRTSRRLLKAVVLESEGLLLGAEGRPLLATDALRASIDAFNSLEYEEPVFLIQTPFESLGRVLMDAKMYDEAIKAYEEGLKARPNSGWLLYGVARAYEEQGKRRAAESAYKVFLKAWATADKDRPELKRAEEFLATPKH